MSRDLGAVVEGPQFEDMLMLEFPSFEEAKAWYNNPAYQRHASTGLTAGTIAPSSSKGAAQTRVRPFRDCPADQVRPAISHGHVAGALDLRMEAMRTVRFGPYARGRCGPQRNGPQCRSAT